MAIREGIGALLSATDYPHAEGTFPFSKQVADAIAQENYRQPRASALSQPIGPSAPLAMHFFVKTIGLTRQEAVSRRRRAALPSHLRCLAKP